LIAAKRFSEFNQRLSCKFLRHVCLWLKFQLRDRLRGYVAVTLLQSLRKPAGSFGLTSPPPIKPIAAPEVSDSSATA